MFSDEEGTYGRKDGTFVRMLRPSNVYVAQPFFCAGNGFYASSIDTVTWNETAFEGNIQQAMHHAGKWYFAVEDDGIYIDGVKALSLQQKFTDANWPSFSFVGGVVNVESLVVSQLQGPVYGPNNSHVADNNLIVGGAIMIEGEEERLEVLASSQSHTAVAVNDSVMMVSGSEFTVSQFADVVDLSANYVATSTAIYDLDYNLIHECRPRYIVA